MNKYTTEVPFGHQDTFYIGGKWVRPSSDSRFDVVTSATGEIYTTVVAAEADDVNRAVSAAREAFDHGVWPRLPVAERAAYLSALGKQLALRSADIAVVWPNEMGVLHSAAREMAGTLEGIFDYYASLALSFHFEERHHPAAGGEVGLLIREAVGVAGIIVPWNGPILSICYKIAPALLAGCACIIKASPEAPGTAYIVAEAAEAAGLPAGVVNVLTADREVSELLVRHEGVDKISFTGSTAAGQRIASICGDRVARCTLELGGKSAAVIFDDYDVEAAAQAIVGPACWLSGQVCSSLTRVIVSHHRHDQLVDALSSRFAAVRVGDPFDPTVDMGPVATRRQRDNIERILAEARAEGAVAAVGGGRPPHLSRGFFIEPTVFGNVDNRSKLARNEIFGPVISVIAADNDAAAIEIANDTVFGLNNSVFTNDPDRAYAAARQLRSGTVGHNVFRTDFSIAFGGFKRSGIGREGGTEGLLPYCETKTVILEGLPSYLRGQSG